MSAKAMVKHITDVAATEVERSSGASIQILLGPDDGMPNFFMRRFTIQPGGRIPTHSHPNIEHEQWVLEGEMVLGLDDEVVVVNAGDSVYIPAEVTHWYENRGEVPVRFLCMVPRTETYETQWL